MEPLNYRLDVRNPFDSALKGVAAGFDIGAAIDKSKQQEFALEQQKQMQSDLAAFAQNQNPTAKDFASITMRYPQLAEHFKNTWSMLNTEQQQNRLGQASQVYAALQSGNNDVAAQLAANQAEAFKNAGMQKDAQSMETLSKLIKLSPETAKTSTGLMLSSILGPDKFTSTFSTLEKLPGEVQKGQAEAQKAGYEASYTPDRLALEGAQSAANLRNIDSQISERAGRLGLDRDKLQTETQLKLAELNQKGTTLETDARKLLNDSAIESVASKQAAVDMEDLANRLTAEGGGWGKFGSASEWYKNATGFQDGMSNLRKEYIRMRGSEVSKMLPPGAASDKDIAIAMSGFPSETADAGHMASFLRGMAKIQNYNSAVQAAKAEWVNSVGHLGRPKGDIEVGGVNVPAGTTFADYAKQFIKKGATAGDIENKQAALGSRSYMRWAK